LGFDETGNGLLKIKVVATGSSVVSTFGFFASVSSGISSVVLIRFF